MKRQMLTDSSLLVTVSPGTVYISTNPDHSSYANIGVVIQNQGTSLSVNSISVTLPAALAAESGLSSITRSAGQPELWSIGPSDFTTPPAGYQALADSDADPCLLTIWPWPDTGPLTFEWADPNDQTGTITLGPPPPGALDAFNEKLKGQEYFNTGTGLENKKSKN